MGRRFKSDARLHFKNLVITTVTGFFVDLGQQSAQEEMTSKNYPFIITEQMIIGVVN